jgi:HEAT repeat protein
METGMGFIKSTTLAATPDNEANTGARTDARHAARDADGLLAALADPDATVRRWAARDLAAHPQAARLLAERLPLETDAAVRDAILASLTAIGNTNAVSGLARCLRSEDVALRNAAIEAMKSMPEAVPSIMARLLDDSDPDVRIFAVNILESLRHPKVEEWLLAVIGADPHVNVCATAVDLLGEVGTSRSAGALHALTARFPDEPYIAFAAELALKRLDQEGDAA